MKKILIATLALSSFLTAESLPLAVVDLSGASVPADPGHRILRSAPDAKGWRRWRGNGLWQVESEIAY